MKKLLALVFVAFLGIFSAVAVSAQMFSPTGGSSKPLFTPELFVRNGGVILPRVPTDTLGSPSNHIAAGYFDYLFAASATISGVGTGSLYPSANNTFDIGASTNTLRIGYFGTDVIVNGQSVCLEDGTNCPAGSTVPTLQQVLAQGNTATSSATFFGGLTSSNFTATGTTSLQGTTFTLATGTAVTSTSGFFNNLGFGSATGTNILATSSTINFLGFGFATATRLNIATQARLPTDTRINSTLVCLVTGTNCPSSYTSLTITTLTSRQILDSSGANASSTLVLSGRSGEVTGIAPTATSTALSMAGFPRTLPAMNPTSTNCIYWGPEFIRDAWDGAIMRPQLSYLAATGTGNIIWSMRAQSMASGTYAGTAFSGAKSYATTTALSGFFTYVSNMDDLTVGAAASGTPMKFELCREGAHGQDTFTGEAYPNSLKIEYSLGSYSD